MAKTLLDTNRRAASLLCVTSTLPVVFGGLVVAWGLRVEQPIISWSGAVLVLVGLLLFPRQLAMLIPPRIALDRDHLAVYLRGFIPWRIPLDEVECFFIGQAPSELRVSHPTGGRVESVTVVVRLAERADSWHQRPVNALLGKWAGGYITMQGIWCEPIDGDLVGEMNHQLAAAKRARRQQPEESRVP